jgi:hypothetical protein
MANFRHRIRRHFGSGCTQFGLASIEKEMADITVLHDVGLSFDAKFACGADFFFVLEPFQVF